MCLDEQEWMTLWSECKTGHLHSLLGFGTGCCTCPEQVTCLCCLFRHGLGLSELRAPCRRSQVPQRVPLHSVSRKHKGVKTLAMAYMT